MEDGAAAASFALEAPNNVFDPIWAYELSQQVILKSKMTIQATVPTKYTTDSDFSKINLKIP